MISSTQIYFKSKVRPLKMILFLGVILFVINIIFLIIVGIISKDNLNLMADYPLVLLAIGLTIPCFYFAYVLFNIPSVVVSSIGISITKNRTGEQCFDWNSIEKLLITTVVMRGRYEVYSGQKLVLVIGGKKIEVVTSFDILHFNKLLLALIQLQPLLPKKLFLQKKFMENSFFARFGAFLIWALLLAMTYSIFMSSESKYYLGS